MYFEPAVAREKLGLALVYRMRCSLKRLVLSIAIVVIGSWLVFLGGNYFFNIRQKSILRYQIEQELSKSGIKLD